MKAISIVALMITTTLLPLGPVFGDESLRIEVIATGAHPNGTQWDGTRIYLLPFEATTVSPPDIELCIIQDDVHCTARTGNSWSPPCPDADRCRFDVILDTLRPFGLMVFDIDGLGKDEVGAAASVIADWADGLQDVPSEMTEWAGPLAGGVKSILAASAGQIDELNARRLEWMDGLMIVPPGEDGPVDLAERMRAVARIYERPLPFFDHEARLSGPFDMQPLDACAWPGPPCLLNYVTIQFYQEEINDD